MLDVAFELIGQAASNSLLMFCFCNLIIVMILRGSKPGSIVEQEMAFSTSRGKNVNEDIITINATPSHNESDGFSIDVPRFSQKCGESVEHEEESGGGCDDDYEDENDEEEEEHEEEEEEEEEDDEDDLRKRVEEFIAKVNKEWKKEKLRALNLADEQKDTL